MATRDNGPCVGGISKEFERQLKKWRRQYAGNPRREMIRLCLLALEREEIVSVAYREERMLSRLQSMPIAQELRNIVHHALLWAWKDEEMHAVYIRGMILKLGGRRLRAMAYSRQMAGALGGWASSVRQHVRWKDAPISYAVFCLKKKNVSTYLLSEEKTARSGVSAWNRRSSWPVLASHSRALLS